MGSVDGAIIPIWNSALDVLTDEAVRRQFLICREAFRGHRIPDIIKDREFIEITPR